MELAAKFAGKAPVARRYILDCVVRGASMPFADAQRMEADLFGLVGATEDVRAGLGAFLDRSKAAWKGR
jgi:enoyl-CoA hydratase